MMTIAYVVGTVAAHLLAWELWLTAFIFALLPFHFLVSGTGSGAVYAGLNYLGISAMMAEFGGPQPSPMESIAPFFTAAIVTICLTLIKHKFVARQGAAK